MRKKLKKVLVFELSWFMALLMVSAAAEYAVIEMFDLHPVLSVKIQGFIGLLIFGYLVRMVARLLSSFRERLDPKNGTQDGLE